MGNLDRHLNAAQGNLELGMFEARLDELEGNESESRLLLERNDPKNGAIVVTKQPFVAYEICSRSQLLTASGSNRIR